ncbi:MAG: DUF5591 domain-containing protein [Candidatus Freyarchaeota archaeon]|nr:DUF5591 domain-containing protein [Candidatus Jordarchaeia archaeon]
MCIERMVAKLKRKQVTSLFEVLRRDGPGRITRARVGSKTFETPNLVFYFVNDALPPPPQVRLVMTYESDMLSKIDGRIKLVPLMSPLISDINEAINYGLSLGADVLIASSPLVTGQRDVAAILLEGLLESARAIKETVKNVPVAIPIYYFPHEPLRNAFLSKVSKLGFKFYVIRWLEKALRNPRDLVAFLREINYFIGSNALLFASGRIPPSYYLHLVYLGIDLFDASFIIDATIRNLYFFDGEWHPLSALSELPCFCEACLILRKSSPSGDEKMRLLLNHNVFSALSILRKASLLIKQSRLRDGVEEACHHSPELAALLRISDREAYQLLEKYTPVSSKSKVYCIGPESYYKPSIERFRTRVATRYTPPKSVAAVLLLPCSARKPYSSSHSHRLFRKVVVEAGVKGVCEGIVTSPLGLVPRELEEVYPAAHYDIPVTGEWDQEEIKIAAECVANYLNKFPDDCPVIAHLNGGYLQACKKASEISGREIIYTEVEGSLTSPPSLSSLKSTLLRFSKQECREIDHLKEVFRKTADYQFGLGAGEKLSPDSATAKTRARGEKILYDGKVLLAHISPSTGFVVPTLEGGSRLASFSHWVLFKGELIKGSSVMVPGVEDADPQIRPGDIVFVLDSSKELVGIGEAILSGEEMSKLSRGVAVKLKHVKRRGE